MASASRNRPKARSVHGCCGQRSAIGVRRDKVAICYDGTAHSLPTVQKAAQDECGPGTLANLLDIDRKLYYCPLLLPTRATFVCQRKE